MYPGLRNVPRKSRWVAMFMEPMQIRTAAWLQSYRDKRKLRLKVRVTSHS